MSKIEYNAYAINPFTGTPMPVHAEPSEYYEGKISIETEYGKDTVDPAYVFQTKENACAAMSAPDYVKPTVKSGEASIAFWLPDVYKEQTEREYLMTDWF